MRVGAARDEVEKGYKCSEKIVFVKDKKLGRGEGHGIVESRERRAGIGRMKRRRRGEEAKTWSKEAGSRHR